jgi:hypothetical protein
MEKFQNEDSEHFPLFCKIHRKLRKILLNGHKSSDEEIHLKINKKRPRRIIEDKESEFDLINEEDINTQVIRMTQQFSGMCTKKRDRKGLKKTRLTMIDNLDSLNSDLDDEPTDYTQRKQRKNKRPYKRQSFVKNEPTPSSINPSIFEEVLPGEQPKYRAEFLKFNSKFINTRTRSATPIRSNFKSLPTSSITTIYKIPSPLRPLLSLQKGTLIQIRPLLIEYLLAAPH